MRCHTRIRALNERKRSSCEDIARFHGIIKFIQKKKRIDSFFCVEERKGANCE